MMGWQEDGRPFAGLLRLGPVLLIAIFLGGCFQPLYGDRGGGSAVRPALAGIEVSASVMRCPMA
jgi:hypothetical protein